MPKCLTGRFVASTLLAFSVWLVAVNASAKSQLLQASDAAAGQVFGDGVAADANTIAVVAQGQPNAVYLFANSNGNWVEQTKLSAPTNTRFNLFPVVQGDTLVIPGVTFDANHNPSATAFIYTNINGTWTGPSLLVPVEQASNFFSAALDGNTLVLGSPGTPGAAFVFVNNGGGWTEQAMLVPSDPATNAFGFNVDVSNDTVAVGAPFSSPSGNFFAGNAFVFVRQNGTWSQQTELLPPDGSPRAEFGSSVSIGGSSIAVGAFVAGDDDAGRAYVFVDDNGTWTQQADLQGQAVTTDADFGFSLKLIGDTLLIGAYDDGSDNSAGTAHIFKRTAGAWSETSRLLPGSNGVTGPLVSAERFANFTAFVGPETSPTFIMGAPTFSTSTESKVGAVYVLH